LVEIKHFAQGMHGHGNAHTLLQRIWLYTWTKHFELFPGRA